MNNKLSKKVILLTSVSTLLFANFAFAQDRQERGPMMGRGNPAVFGTVTSSAGNTITISSSAGPRSTTTKSYTVDATNATVFKNNATSSLSNIVFGDKILVQGTLSGTTITAKIIRDDVMAKNLKTGEGERREFSSTTKEMNKGDFRNGNASTTHFEKRDQKGDPDRLASGTPQVLGENNNVEHKGILNSIKSFFGRMFGF